VLGALNLSSDRGKLLLVLGMGLGSLGGLDTALREHLAGYRSHTSLISAVVAMVVAIGLGVGLNAADVNLPQWPLLVVAVLVFAGMFRLMRQKFKERSGGLGFRV
jgi:hypothetical protein